MTSPSMIRTDDSNFFAHHTVGARLPAIAREVQALNPDYPAEIMRGLEALAVDLETNAPIKMLNLPAPDYDDWKPACDAHDGHRWQETDWFFAETYFYRYMMQVVRFFEIKRDPFQPKKDEELASESLWKTIEIALEKAALPTPERLRAMIVHALWGNRIDLSFAAALARGHNVEDDDLIVDDSEKAVEYLLSGRRNVHILTDNTGTELATDLTLADALLDAVAESVTLHPKMHPTFVSDATIPDVLALLRAMCHEQKHGSVRALGDRLFAALYAGRFRLAPDFFWNSSRILWDLPPRLQGLFTSDSLVIVKGDANYRRMVADTVWQPDLPLATVTEQFPAPLLAMRSLKSDPIAGLPTGLAEKLDSIDPEWRVNAKRGVIQCTA